MRKSFWGLIWSSFLEIQGWLIGFVGIGITLLFLRFPIKTPIPLDLIIIISFFSLLLVVTLLQSILKIFKQNQNLSSELEQLKQTNQNLHSELDRLGLPKIVLTRKYQVNQQNFAILCLLEYSELFSNDSYISFYYKDDDGFEVLIGVGYIETVQTDGKIQAVLEYPISVYQEIVNKLANNDTTIVSRTAVKPNITRDMIRTMNIP